MPLEPSERAIQLGAPPITDADVFSPPSYSENFTSEQFPYMNGKVVLRLPSFGDDVEIARLSALDGQTVWSSVAASLSVCLETAPPAWYRKLPNLDKPILAIGRLHDSAGLINLYTRWQTWRANFRQGVPSEPAQS